MDRAGSAGRKRPASERFSLAVTRAAGTTSAFIGAVALIAGWLVTGPIFHFSDTWQLIINTTTTIVTFLMVFLIQRTQNKDARAMSSKLNELIAVIEGASNRLIDVESLSEEELETIHRHYQRLALMAKREASITLSHSIEEAESRHQRKASANSRSGRAPARRPRRRRRVPVAAERTLPMSRQTP